WRTHRFAALTEIDCECARFNAESEAFFRFKFAIRLTGKHLRYRQAAAAIDADSLRTVRGKRVCFISFVECWRERNQEVGIAMLERFIELPIAYLNQYVFVTLDLASATLLILSETQGHTTLV